MVDVPKGKAIVLGRVEYYHQVDAAGRNQRFAQIKQYRFPSIDDMLRWMAEVGLDPSLNYLYVAFAEGVDAPLDLHSLTVRYKLLHPDLKKQPTYS